MKEIWKDLIGYEGIYQISNLGKVRSLDRYIFNKGNGKNCFKHGVLLNCALTSEGYVEFSFKKDGKKKNLRLNRLVISHFSDISSSGFNVIHLDGNRANNAILNLKCIPYKKDIVKPARRRTPMNFEDRGLEPTQELLKKYFDYKDGKLYRRIPTYGTVVGKLAGGKAADGYYQMSFLDKLRRTHRMIFMYHHGYLPATIDHIDGDPANNRIENLRDVTLQQNSWNKRAKRNGTSKYKGVYFYKRTKRWNAFIGINGKQIFLGSFVNEIDAAKAFENAAKSIHGEYLRLQ